MLAPSSEDKDAILSAVQLGWLSVEAFGLLRRYARHGKPPSPEKVDATQRFNFTERDPNLTEQLLIAVQMLKATAAGLTPNLSPPVPDDPSILLEEAKKDINHYWSSFEDWSRQVWNNLHVTEPLAGQAFACGGDLADTFWYAQGAGAEKLADMLRSYRLRYVAERVDDLADHLPEHVAQAIHYSLEQWGIGETAKSMDEAGQKRLMERLESQVKVWRDLLFGLRRSSSYLTARDRRRIAWGALAASAGLVVLVSLVVWLAVLLLAVLGRLLIGSAMNLPFDTAKISADMLAYLSNWQNWSALLATLSSVVVILAGFISQLSGWMIAFHKRAWAWLKFRRIFIRTYRRWDQ